MKKLFSFLLAVALAAVLSVQILNLSYVLTVGGLDWLSVLGVDLRLLVGITWAVGIELGVLVSVLAGHKPRAVVLAIGSFAVNMLISRIWNQELHVAAAKCAVYAISGYLLWYFSELFAQQAQASQHEQAQHEQIQHEQIQHQQAQHEQDQHQQIQHQQDQHEQATIEPRSWRPILVPPRTTRQRPIATSAAGFSCPACQRTFATQKALNGHMRSHAIVVA